MDIGTIIGLLGALGLIVGSMALGDGGIGPFVNLPSALIVFGGTIMTTLINQTLPNVLAAFKSAMNAFFIKLTPPEELVPVIISLAQKARKEGLVSLEGEEIPDPFLARGVRLGVDGLSPEVVRATLTAELISLKERHQRGQKVFRFMAGTGPAMGMIGTLIGLVQMLLAMDDPSAIGPAMAVALLTTLYGAVLAFVICNPIADKLENRTKDEVSQRMLAIVGVESILKGDNTMVIQSRLDAYLAPSVRTQDKE